MTDELRKELFSERVAAGSRTYFIDIKESADGTKYLVISESRQDGEKWEHHRVMVFEEHLESFREAFQKATEFLTASKKAYSVGAIRRTHPRAYEPWSPEEGERLRARCEEGFDIPELARVFQRQEGAIRSRLKKLGLTARADKARVAPNEGMHPTAQKTGGG